MESKFAEHEVEAKQQIWLQNISWCASKKKWAVQLSINGRQTNLGRFDDLEFADLVATEARDKYHGAFARHL